MIPAVLLYPEKRGERTIFTTKITSLGETHSVAFLPQKPPKCKVLFANRPCSLLNTQISVTTVADEISGNSVNIYLAENVFCVSAAVLRSLSLSHSTCGLVATAACSVADGVTHAVSHTIRRVSGAPLLVATAIYTLTHTNRVILDGGVFCFTDTKDGLTVSDPSPTVLTLFTADP